MIYKLKLSTMSQRSLLQKKFHPTHDYQVENVPPLVDHLDVVGGLTPSMKWKPRIQLTREPGRAVALGRVLVLTCPNFNDLFSLMAS
jgi:hypothetical protein